MSSKFSSTAVSSHSSTPGFLLSDEYLAADLSDLDEPDTLPALSLDSHSHSGRSDGREAAAVEADEDGVARLAVDDETRAQLREIQGALSAQLEGRPHPSHFSTAFAHQRAAHDKLRAAVKPAAASARTPSHTLPQADQSSTASIQRELSSIEPATSPSSDTSSASTSQSTLLELLASKEADLRLAAELGAALSDKTDALEQYCRRLEQQLASSHQHPPPDSHDTTLHNGTRTQLGLIPDSASAAHRTSHSLSSIADGSASEEEVARLRSELLRLERRMALSEGWHRDALKAARSEKREAEERMEELEKDGKRREADEREQRKREEEERVRLTEEVEQLRAIEQQRVARERGLRRQREAKEKEDEDEQRYKRDESLQAEGRLREEQRRREDLERRCRALEKQRDEASERAAQQAREAEQRHRRLEQERGRAVEDELERHRSQAKALADQYRAVEEQLRQSGKRRTLSVDTSGRLSPAPASPPASATDEVQRERRAVQVSHSTQTPGEWSALDRAESAMTIPKGRGESERVAYSPLHFTLLSPPTADAAAAKETSEEKREAVVEEQLAIPLSLVTPPRQATRSPFLSPHSPLPRVVELTDEDERALVDIVAPTLPTAAAEAGRREVVTTGAVPPTVSFLSPLYTQPAGTASSSSPASLVAPSTLSASQPVVSVVPTPATPLRRALATTSSSALLARPAFRSPQPTPPSTLSSSTASSPLLFTLHTAHPSSIRAHLAASSAAAPPPALLPLSSPFAQLQSSLVKPSGGAGGSRLQPCTDDATKRVFSLLMKTRMGDGVAGFG